MPDDREIVPARMLRARSRPGRSRGPRGQPVQVARKTTRATTPGAPALDPARSRWWKSNNEQAPAAHAAGVEASWAARHRALVPRCAARYLMPMLVRSPTPEPAAHHGAQGHPLGNIAGEARRRRHENMPIQGKRANSSGGQTVPVISSPAGRSVAFVSES